LRIFPSAFTEHAFRTFEKNYRERVVVYLHPWELDPEQPRIPGPLKSRLRHYSSLRRMENKLSAILSRHKFQRFSDVLAGEVPEDRTLAKPAGKTTNQEMAEQLEIAAQQGRGRR
jgi:hypothetical protein